MVIIAAPANAHPDLLRAVAPFIDDGAAVGALFAQVILRLPFSLQLAATVLAVGVLYFVGAVRVVYV